MNNEDKSSSQNSSVEPAELETHITDDGVKDELNTLKAKLEDAESKAKENWDKLLRSQADQENIKRRTARDLENAHKFALEKFALELLPIKDSLELGAAAATDDHADESLKKIQDGIALTLNMLDSAFKKFNIEEVKAAGEKFNPDHHQAMSTQPSADVEPNTVLNVFQKGYLLNGRLLRPAMVVVSQKAPDNKENTEIDEMA
ncbi:MAG TPA: nucleotide exchange factor GrpE [Gammaproteobacteria bacterium]|nr:nucleotide exchange factor GrpE [Gammaproteobacteria bacterium]